MTTIVRAVLGWIISFFGGRLFERKSEGQKRAEEVVDNYRSGEKIDAEATIDNNSLRNWYVKLRK